MTPRERAQRLPGQVATTDAGGKPISYCVVSVDAIEGAIVAALAEAKRDANREACDLCHCCGEQRHDGGDPCVSCARAVAEERERVLEAVKDYLRCIPCPPFCSQAPGGPHVDYCCKSVAEEPGPGIRVQP